MKSLQKNRSIQENLNDPEFIKALQNHSIVKDKVAQAKKVMTTMKTVPSAEK